ncbi:MAG: ThiF family adenylyltransferase [Deltaproteobacteria bacterium]|nr:ThiF family adenylyltransferase [Deltaproteobacteria bacterium]
MNEPLHVTLVGAGAAGSALAQLLARWLSRGSRLLIVDRDCYDPEGLALVTGVGPSAAGSPKALALAEALAPEALARGVSVKGMVADADLDLGPGFYLGRSGAVVLAVDTLHAVLSVSRDVALAGGPARLLRVNLAGAAGAQVQRADPNPEGACLACTLHGHHAEVLAAERSCSSPRHASTVSTRTSTTLAAAWLGAAVALDALRDPVTAARFRKVDLRAAVSVIDASVDRSPHCLAGHQRLGAITRLGEGPRGVTARALGLGEDGARVALPGAQVLWEGLRCDACGRQEGGVHFGPEREAPCGACGRPAHSVASPRATLGPEELDPDADLGALGLPPHAVLTVLRGASATHFTFNPER